MNFMLYIFYFQINVMFALLLQLRKIMDNPPRLIGLLDARFVVIECRECCSSLSLISFGLCSYNNLTFDSLLPFENSFILRLNIKGNPQLDVMSRDEILEKLHQVWVINDDFVKTAETTTWGDSENTFYRGGFQIAPQISDRQRDVFDVVINHLPKKNQSADYFKLDFLLDDYAYQAYVHNSGSGTKLGTHKPMPAVNFNDLLMMKHADRLDLAVLLTTRLFFRVPEVVFKDVMEKLLVSYMTLNSIRDLISMPPFVLTGIISLIIRICRREAEEFNVNLALMRKDDIPGLVTGDAFLSSLPPSRDSSGFRYLKSIRLFLSRGIVQDIRKNTDVRNIDQGDAFSELEHEILRCINDIPTKATFPKVDTPAYRAWVPFIARHTLVMMTKVSSCPPLTKCQTSKASQQCYNQLHELLKAAEMTYEDMNITTNGPTLDGRGNSDKTRNVLDFGAGLPNATYGSLTWNGNNISRPYAKPWKGVTSCEDMLAEINCENDVRSLDDSISSCQQSVDIADLSVGGGDDLSETSRKASPNRLKKESSMIPFMQKDEKYVLDDEEDALSSPSSAQKEGRPWSVSLKSSVRSKSLESFYLSDSNPLDTSKPLQIDVESPIVTPMVLSPIIKSPPMKSHSPKLTMIRGFSAESDRHSRFALASPSKVDCWRSTTGNNWTDIQFAPVLVHPLSKYPVYMTRRLDPAANDHNDVCDVYAADRKDWEMHVQDNHPKPFLSDISGLAKYKHNVFKANQRKLELKALSDTMKEKQMNEADRSKLLKDFLKSKDPDEPKNNLLKEMGTTRNLRCQKEMAIKIKKEILRQRKEEEIRRHYSYRGIQLEGGSIMSQESFATLDTKDNSLKSESVGIDLNRVSWSTFMKKEPAGPTLDTIRKMPTNEDGTFMTEPKPQNDMSRPPSPSNTPLAYVPSPAPLIPDHAFRYQDAEDLVGVWDTAVPLATHVRKALKYSAVYTNSDEIDWGAILTSGRATTTWYPRPEKFTFTLDESTPVNVARMELTNLPPHQPSPPRTSSTNPIDVESISKLAKAQQAAFAISNTSEGPATIVADKKRPCQRLGRPDKSRQKYPLPPPRITAPAFTTNFTNFSLPERDPIFMEVTEQGELSSASSVPQSVDGSVTTIFNGSVESSEIEREYVNDLTIAVDVENSLGDVISVSAPISRAPSQHDNPSQESVGSASLSCGSSERDRSEKKAAQIRRQRLEVRKALIYCLWSQLTETSGHFFRIYLCVLRKDHS